MIHNPLCILCSKYYRIAVKRYSEVPAQTHAFSGCISNMLGRVVGYIVINTHSGVKGYILVLYILGGVCWIHPCAINFRWGLMDTSLCYIF